MRLRIERGESPGHATESARRDFGNVTLVKEITRDMWGWRLFEDFARDLRYSVRLLARSPMFEIVLYIVEERLDRQIALVVRDGAGHGVRRAVNLF